MEELQQRIVQLLPKSSIGRYDLLPVLADKELSREIARQLAEPYRDKADIVVAPEALGWLLGEKIAAELDVPLLPLRKGEKLPYASEELYRVAFMDYSGHRKSLETAKNAPLDGKRVLIVDEWIETGAQIEAVMALLEKFDCSVAGIATIGADMNERTQSWIEQGIFTCICRDL